MNQLSRFINGFSLNRLVEPFQRDVPMIDEYANDYVDDYYPEVGGVAEAAVAAPFTLRTPLRPKLLEARDFRLGTFRANEWSVIGSFEVPPGILKRIPADLPYRMYIKAVHRVAGNNAASAAPRTITGIPSLIRTNQGLPTLPTLHHPEIVVWTAPTPGTVFTQQAVSAVDYAARSVTYTEPANTTHVEIYYVHDDGEWRFRSVRAQGVSDTVALSVANGSFGAVHTVDQNNAETTHRWPRVVNLAPRQSISFEVRSAREMTFDARAQQMLFVLTEVAQIDVNDPVGLANFIEAEMRA